VTLWYCSVLDFVEETCIQNTLNLPFQWQAISWKQKRVKLFDLTGGNTLIKLPPIKVAATCDLSSLDSDSESEYEV
jgi:hypothetical protein